MLVAAVDLAMRSAARRKRPIERTILVPMSLQDPSRCALAKDDRVTTSDRASRVPTNSLFNNHVAESMRQWNTVKEAASVTCGMVGRSGDLEVSSPSGTAVFIAPNLAITAAHVLKGYWDELQAEHLRGHYPRKTVPAEIYLDLFHGFDLEVQLSAWWTVTEVTICTDTDIAFLHVFPSAEDEAATSYSWPFGFPKLRLLPLHEAACLDTLGYPGSMTETVEGHPTPRFRYDAQFMHAHVTDIFPVRRDRGLINFPSFSFDIRAKPGMSGAPIWHAGELSGIVSSSSDFDNTSYGAALWPLVFANLTFEIQGTRSVRELMRREVIQARDWQLVSDKARRESTEDDTTLRLDL